MTIDNDFQSVLRTLMATYDDQWLIPQLADAFNRLRERPLNGVRTHSVEVYDGENLVAGEIGYSVGPVYTSLSGFHRKDGAGTVQLVMLANVLKEAQFLFWDLGMEAEYKMRLGATLIEREAFLSLYRRSTRDETNSHPLPRGPWSCREYLDQPVGRDKI